MMLNLSGLLVWILMLTFLLPPKGLMKHFEVVPPASSPFTLFSIRAQATGKVVVIVSKIIP